MVADAGLLLIMECRNSLTGLMDLTAKRFPFPASIVAPSLIISLNHIPDPVQLRKSFICDLVAVLSDGDVDKLVRSALSVLYSAR